MDQPTNLCGPSTRPHLGPHMEEDAVILAVADHHQPANPSRGGGGVEKELGMTIAPHGLTVAGRPWEGDFYRGGLAIGRRAREETPAGFYLRLPACYCRNLDA
ncbi:hypothetical protein E2562_019659 [Oryza meyeriana var. granulata]|uniref:Uncharacterized protein n=1 Tax=Oryza meyeriana var. granulata TaxID=110450 RepID=A0A6G1C7R6_9ORYZ|nr:hypothetical protein E2562_019659 [Oryza meyeriana var. granulata]